MKSLTLPSNCTIRIKGIQYRVVDRQPVIGDMIIDRNDGLYAIVEAIMDNDRLVIRDGVVMQIGVDLLDVYTLEQFGSIN